MSGAPVYGEFGLPGLIIKRYGVNIALGRTDRKSLAMFSALGKRADDSAMWARIIL